MTPRRQVRPSLFSTDQHFTKEALELDAELGECLHEVWQRWLARGYGIQEIGAVMSMKVWEMVMEYVLQCTAKQ